MSNLLHPSKQPECRIVEGGGMLFTDDLWKCATCGQEKYPEAFTCRIDPKRRCTPESKQ